MTQTLTACAHCGQRPSGEEAVHKVGRPWADGTQLWRAGCVESAGGCGAEVTGRSAQEAIARWEARVTPKAHVSVQEEPWKIHCSGCGLIEPEQLLACDQTLQCGNCLGVDWEGEENSVVLTPLYRGDNFDAQDETSKQAATESLKTFGECYDVVGQVAVLNLERAVKNPDFQKTLGRHSPAASARKTAVPVEWVEAVQEFVDRVERGEVRSRKTYAKFQKLLAALNSGEVA